MPLLFDSDVTDEDSDPFVLMAKQLCEAIRNHAVGHQVQKYNWKKWHKDLRLLHTKDGFTCDEIKDVMDWLCRPEIIRAVRVRSGARFRLHFNRNQRLAKNYKGLTAYSIDWYVAAQAEMFWDRESYRLQVSKEDLLICYAAYCEQVTDYMRKMLSWSSGLKKIDRVAVSSFVDFYSSTIGIQTLVAFIERRLQEWVTWGGDPGPHFQINSAMSRQALAAGFRNYGVEFSVHSQFNYEN
jgi:hypothetical protein